MDVYRIHLRKYCPCCLKGVIHVDSIRLAQHVEILNCAKDDESDAFISLPPFIFQLHFCAPVWDTWQASSQCAIGIAFRLFKLGSWSMLRSSFKSTSQKASSMIRFIGRVGCSLTISFAPCCITSIYSRALLGARVSWWLTRFAWPPISVMQ